MRIKRRSNARNLLFVIVISVLLLIFMAASVFLFSAQSLGSGCCEKKCQIVGKTPNPNINPPIDITDLPKAAPEAAPPNTISTVDCTPKLPKKKLGEPCNPTKSECGPCLVCESSRFGISAGGYWYNYQGDLTKPGPLGFNLIDVDGKPINFMGSTNVGDFKCTYGYNSQGCEDSNGNKGACRVSSGDVRCATDCSATKPCPDQFFGMVCGRSIGDAANADTVYRVTIDSSCVNGKCVQKYTEKKQMAVCPAGACISNPTLKNSDRDIKHFSGTFFFSKVRQKTDTCKNRAY
jgi:hypothetical protein